MIKAEEDMMDLLSLVKYSQGSVVYRPVKARAVFQKAYYYLSK